MNNNFIFTLLLFLIIGVVVGQECGEFYTVESNVLDCLSFSEGRPIYTNAQLGLTQEALTAAFLAPQPPLNLSARDPTRLMPYDCAVSYLRMICPTFYRTCTTFGGAVPLGAPLKVCRSECERSNNICSDFWNGFGLPGVDCAGREDPLSPGQPLFPLDADAQCFRWINDTQQFGMSIEQRETDTIWECPQPLKFRGRNGDPLPCQLDCMDQASLVVHGDDFDNGFLAYSILWWISAVLLLSLFVAYTILPEMRQFPRRLVIGLTFGQLLIAIAAIGSSVQDFESFYCEDEWTLSSNGWCRGAGFMFVFGSLIASFYWWWQTFVLWWNVGLLASHEKLLKLEWVMHAITWIVATVVTFVLFGLDHLGARTAQPYCFTFDTTAELEWGVVFFWYFAFCVFVPGLLLWVMARIWKESTLEQSRWERSRYQVQLGLFALAYFVSIIVIVSFRFWVETHQSDVEDGAAAYYECIIRAQQTEEQCEDLLVYVDRNLWWASLILLSVQGLWPFIVFGILNFQLHNVCRQRVTSITNSADQHSGAR